MIYLDQPKCPIHLYLIPHIFDVKEQIMGRHNQTPTMKLAIWQENNPVEISVFGQPF